MTSKRTTKNGLASTRRHELIEVTKDVVPAIIGSAIGDLIGLMVCLIVGGTWGAVLGLIVAAAIGSLLTGLGIYALVKYRSARSGKGFHPDS